MGKLGIYNSRTERMCMGKLGIYKSRKESMWESFAFIKASKNWAAVSLHARKVLCKKDTQSARNQAVTSMYKKGSSVQKSKSIIANMQKMGKEGVLCKIVEVFIF